jgi:eukaryotic-like serine/threonine-protein kinase
MSSLLGTTMGGRYRLESRIGSGGMSTVYRAHDETLERWVAIKVMNREVATDSDQLERFRREARAVARLSHPNIVHVIDAGEDDQRPYIVFEYIEGENLKERIRRVGPLPIPEAVAYSIEIARALGAAHASHIVHRDVKSQNVLIDPEGTAKVTDFGIARTLEEDGLTDDGRVLGTTDYVSPEQALGHSVTGQSDLYSLGVTLFEMVTGELPFTAETQVGVAMQHVQSEIPDVCALRPEVSANLAAVIETAMAKDLHERYADDAEMIADLEGVLALETTRTGSADGEVTAVLKTLPPRTRERVPLAVRHRRTALALIALAFAVIIAAVVVLVVHAHHDHSGPGGRQGGGGGGSTPVSICTSCVSAYNPYGKGGIAQNDTDAPLAVDGKSSTAWSTESYYYGGGQLGKPGVGIYVYASGAVAATKLVVETSTTGFTATIYGSVAKPDLTSFRHTDWVPLAPNTKVSTNQQPLNLNTDGKSYRYYLVWITRLASDAKSASINEIKLYR